MKGKDKEIDLDSVISISSQQSDREERKKNKE